jgi:hypothetical protein
MRHVHFKNAIGFVEKNILGGVRVESLERFKKKCSHPLLAEGL